MIRVENKTPISEVNNLLAASAGPARSTAMSIIAKTRLVTDMLIADEWPFSFIKL